MIAVDTSALMAIVLNEPEADLCAAVLEIEDDVLISAGTVAEALIMAEKWNVSAEMSQLLDGLGFQFISVTSATARRVADVYTQWGRGSHPAKLNFGDCFSYDVAKENGCPLLFVGHGFSHTDIRSAIG
ncbi:type II toxin-antitoxin system VapC family toxin [Amphibiibacter pelophylacis]|uniref:Type II toxin-antitoxin system VapC family toxin n=1 Tax=Amphibiibacter pelophylacis TaxID=1799477 RepID=A0ACC6P3V8_9BURK